MITYQVFCCASEHFEVWECKDGKKLSCAGRPFKTYHEAGNWAEAKMAEEKNGR